MRPSGWSERHLGAWMARIGRASMVAERREERMSSGLRDAVEWLRHSLGSACAHGVPGLALLYGMGNWFEFPHALFRSFLKPTEATPALVVAFTFAMGLGVLLGSLRWAIFEMLLCRGYRLSESTTEGLEPPRRRALLLARERYFRRHQILAHMTLALPLVFAGFLSNHAPFMSAERVILLGTGFLAILTVATGAACAAYKEWVSAVTRLVTSESATIPFRRAPARGVEAS